jgi:aconitate hydratase
MSPSLVIVYSLIGTMKFDLFDGVVGIIDDKDIRLKDLWPTNQEVGEYMQQLDYTLYKQIYKNIFKGNQFWQNLEVPNTSTYNWDENSNYIQPSKLFDELTKDKINIEKAGILAMLGDFISTDDISPLGQIPLYSPAAKYLENRGVKSFEYNTYASRRGNSQIMLRGLFENIKQNLMVSKEGGYTMDYEAGEIVSIYEKSEKYKTKNRDLIILAGKDYGVGSTRDWAAKGTRLLGVKAVIAKSFDPIHRLNLISFGVLPLEFIDDDIKSLKLKGNEEISIFSDEIKEHSTVIATIHKNGLDILVDLKCRLENNEEVNYYKNGGVLSYLLKKMVK